MSNPGIVSQARMGSTRLPGKVLKTVNNNSLLEYHLDRVRKTGLPVIVATTTKDRDKDIVELCENINISYYCGSENDVLIRYQQTAEAYNLDPIIRVTSDCPLLDPHLIQEGLNYFKDQSLDYFHLGYKQGYPHGLDFQIFSEQALEQAHRETSEPEEREHVIPYLERSSEFTTGTIRCEEDYSDIRITIDYPEDWDLFTTLITEYDAHALGFQELVELFESNQNLEKINELVKAK